MRLILCLASAACLAVIIRCANHAEWQFAFKWVRSIPCGDKASHFLLVGGFTFVLNWTMRGRTVRMLNRDWFLASAIVLAFSSVEEFAQLWLPTRSFDLGDLIANALGIFAFGWLARRILFPHSPAPPR